MKPIYPPLLQLDTLQRRLADELSLRAPARAPAPRRRRAPLRRLLALVAPSGR